MVLEQNFGNKFPSWRSDKTDYIWIEFIKAWFEKHSAGMYVFLSPLIGQSGIGIDIGMYFSNQAYS